MAGTYAVPDSSSPTSSTSSPSNNNAPTTPDRQPQRGHGRFNLDSQPSTTPAGPPPSSSVASFVPSESRSFSGHGSRPPSYGPSATSVTGRNLFGRKDAATGNSSIGRSIRGRERGPSSLSRQYNFDDDADDHDMDTSQDDVELPSQHGGLFRMSRREAPAEQGAAGADGDKLDMEAEIERFITQDMEMEVQDTNADGVSDDDGSDEGDLFLNMRHDDRPYGQPIIGEDLIMLNTPAAAEKVRKEARDIFRRSSVHVGNPSRNKEFRFGKIAKDFYTGRGAATLTEPSELILSIERLVSNLYDDGVGTEEDEYKMDNSLATVSFRLTKLLNDYIDTLPRPDGEDLTSIGPGAQAQPLEKATYVANLILRMHHTRFEDDHRPRGGPPLPEVLFIWMSDCHNRFPDQVQMMAQQKPSPASHSMFWQTLGNALLRGNVAGASRLLKNAGWENVRKAVGGERAYTGRGLDNVQRFAAAACEIIDQCPAVTGDWDVWNSAWTRFRVRAKGALDQMTLFAEGRDTSMQMHDHKRSTFNSQSMYKMATEASSQLPWDFYEHLQVVYGILLGRPESILDTAQDWCEATVGLFGWWDDSTQRQKSLHRLKASSTSRFGAPDDYLDRLSSAFHKVVESNLNPNTLDPVEVAVASAFEGNILAVIGCIRIWSLPVACAVAEIASMGEWLPPTAIVSDSPTDGLDMDDLIVLGITKPTDDEKEGIKDNSLVLYARELAGIEHLSPQLDGWEMAIQVLGRMDVSEKSEKVVAELLRDLIATFDKNSSAVVDKLWKILNDLGMIVFAEETAENFANILARDSHRYGEAVWYYALSHNAEKVRSVLHLLISYSLIYSTAFPPEKDLDDDLRDLLRNRTATLERRAKQDIEAAQLLGRMLSGYATLRRFYELRDQCAGDDGNSPKTQSVRKQAASALVAVVSSSDDNIRGGLYDDKRDAVVGMDCLLVLLGEATAFLNQKPPSVTLEQIDVLLKAVEDLQTVGSRVYDVCDDFFQVVLSSGQGLRGSTPADLMRRSTTGGGGSGSYVMTASSVAASQLHKTVTASGKTIRGWDWRKQWQASTTGQDVLRRLRLGLVQDLATLWLQEADEMTTF